MEKNEIVKSIEYSFIFKNSKSIRLVEQSPSILLKVRDILKDKGYESEFKEEFNSGTSLNDSRKDYCSLTIKNKLN